MSPEQEKQFTDFGCACRCLIVLANAAGASITKAEFVDRFSPDYPYWDEHKQCGVTDTGMVFDIARKLNLARSFQIFRNPKEVRNRIRQRRVRAALLFTEKKEEAPIDGQRMFSDYFHCSIAMSGQLPDDRFPCAGVNADLSLALFEVPDTDLDLLGGYFAVFT